MNDDPLHFVGERVRAIRLERGLTARELAEASGLALNTISLIERGKISPTVATLHKLATALGVSLASFVEDSGANNVIFLKGGQRRSTRSGQVIMENLGSGLANQAMQAFLLTLEPHADSGQDPIVHLGHELVFCLEGCIEYRVEDKIFRLEPEDSLLFEAQLPHRWWNPTEMVSRALLIIQAPLEGDSLWRRHVR